MKYIFKFGNYTAQWKDIIEFYNKVKELAIRAALNLQKNIFNERTLAK